VLPRSVNFLVVWCEMSGEGRNTVPVKTYLCTMISRHFILGKLALFGMMNHKLIEELLSF
jgi:hypothetical protein